MLYINCRLRFGSQQNGFAMMPVILTVLLMGALIGVGLTLIAPRVKRKKYTQTNNTITAAIQAITGWSVTNGRLPDTSEFPAVVRNIDDAWRKSLVYVYDSDFAASSTSGICGRQTTNITYGTIVQIAFLIISGGDDYTVDSTPNTSGPYNGTVTASPNDIVRQVTLEKLRNKAGCYAKTMGRLGILNNELPRACTGQPYTAILYAEGGVPFPGSGNYKWCLKSPPGWLTSIPNTPSCPSTSDCSSLGSEASSQWSQADTIQLGGTPTATGNFPITVLVRDNNDNSPGSSDDNCAQQIFSIAVTTCP